MSDGYDGYYSEAKAEEEIERLRLLDLGHTEEEVEDIMRTADEERGES